MEPAYNRASVCDTMRPKKCSPWGSYPGVYLKNVVSFNFMFGENVYPYSFPFQKLLGFYKFYDSVRVRSRQYFMNSSVKELAFISKINFVDSLC
jgi:hypothetical protein